MSTTQLESQELDLDAPNGSIPQGENDSRPNVQRTSPEDISRRAYELFLKRGGQHGRDVEDWLRAERELSGASRS